MNRWVRWAAAAMLVTCAAVLMAGCGQPKLDRDTMAIVGNRTISRDTYNTRLKIFQLFYQQPMDDVTKKQQVLDQMVTDQLVRDQAADLGVSVTDAQVEAEMARFLGALDRNYGTRDAVNQKLKELGLTNADLAAFLKDFLVGQAVVEKKKAQVTVSEDEMRAFYDQKKDTLYTFKEDVIRAAHILVPLDQEKIAQEVAAKAKAGGDFAELARIYSVDPVSAQQGGDLGYFTRSAMVREFSDAAFNMEAGRTSDPVRSPYGWHIILVKDKQGPGVLPYEKAKDDILNRLTQEKQDKAYQQWLSSLEKGTKIVKAPVAE
jgi:foldase protein PrsA